MTVVTMTVVTNIKSAIAVRKYTPQILNILSHIVVKNAGASFAFSSIVEIF